MYITQIYFIFHIQEKTIFEGQMYFVISKNQALINNHQTNLHIL